MKTSPLYKIKQVIHSLRSKFEYKRNLKNHLFIAQLETLHQLKDIHSGERCFIIGNGPSLKKMDLMMLKGEFTFGLNRIYLLFENIGFSTSYFVCSNRLVLSQFKDEIIQNVPSLKFTTWDNYDIASDIPKTHFVYRHNGAGFYGDISKGLWGGSTVTYMAMQVAFHMGFQETILIGVDHSFTTTGTPNKVVESDGDDPNHFEPSYFGKGIRWQLPDLETSEYAYSLGLQHYENAGRVIKDATIDGKLKIFPKVDYYSLWG